MGKRWISKIASKLAIVFFLLVCTDGYGKIYDCFCFFNELELLEVRFNELWDSVDYFVLVESSQTHQGQEKPLIFWENRHRFEKYWDKVIYVDLTEPLDTDDSWIIEGFQRDQILQGLSQCQDEDVIFVSDADEIVDHRAVSKILDALESQWLVRCKQRMFFLYLNRESVNWTGTYAVRFGDLKHLGANHIRQAYIHHMPGDTNFDLADAGWHFTSMGGLERFRKKLESFAHAELNTDYCKSEAYFLERLEECKLVEIDDSFPSFILNNIDQFRDAGFIQ